MSADHVSLRGKNTRSLALMNQATTLPRMLTVSFSDREAYIVIPDCVSRQDLEGFREGIGATLFEFVKDSRSWICRRGLHFSGGVSKRSTVIVIAKSSVETFKHLFDRWVMQLLAARTHTAQMRRLASSTKTRPA